PPRHGDAFAPAGLRGRRAGLGRSAEQSPRRVEQPAVLEVRPDEPPVVAGEAVDDHPAAIEQQGDRPVVRAVAGAGNIGATPARPEVAAERLDDRGQRRAPGHKRPRPRKLTTCWSATRKWSWTAMRSGRPASTTCRVESTSLA